MVVYRINYLNFPVISELESIYANYEEIFNIVSNYKIQLDFVVKTKSEKNLGGFLLRRYRLPFVFKGKKHL